MIFSTSDFQNPKRTPTEKMCSTDNTHVSLGMCSLAYTSDKSPYHRRQTNISEKNSYYINLCFQLIDEKKNQKHDSNFQVLLSMAIPQQCYLRGSQCW